MSKFYGKNGAVYFGGVQVAHVASWTAEFTTDKVESTPARNGNGWKDYVAGDKEWSASVTCFTDNTNSNTFSNYLGEDTFFYELTLQFDDTNYAIIGTGFLTEFNPSVPVNGVATHTLQFTGVPNAVGVGPVVV